jgi:hypothetical protein
MSIPKASRNRSKRIADAKRVLAYWDSITDWEAWSEKQPGADMKKQNEGLTAEQMAGTAYNAYRWAMGLKDGAGNTLPDWGGLNDGQQAGWARVATVAINMIDDCVELPWVNLAAAAYTEFTEFYRPSNAAVSWDGLGAQDKLAWSAAVRHIANMMAVDESDNEDIDGHERFWQQWAAGRLTQQPS